MGSTLAVLKQQVPVYVAEYAVAAQSLLVESAFEWWAQDALKKWDVIVPAVNNNIGSKMHYLESDFPIWYHKHMTSIEQKETPSVTMLTTKT
jgi:hypothetical protein